MSNQSAVRLSIVGSGFVARGLSMLIAHNQAYEVSRVLTRRPANGSDNFGMAIGGDRITNSADELVENSDLVIECSGDPVHATDVVSRALEAGLPVVTMDSELHVTTGSWLSKKGLITEAEGDQPGSIAALEKDARAMGFTPIVLGNVKGFLNRNPPEEDMRYWSRINGISLTQVTSFTDGTKIQIEQAFVANGFDTAIARDGLIGCESDTVLAGAEILAEAAARSGTLISDYVLSPKSNPGVFIVGTHDHEQAPFLKYYKLGDGPFYILVRPFHLCHLEILKTVGEVLAGGDVLLNNGPNPQISVAAIAKRELEPGEVISRGIGSFDVRGEAVRIADHRDHIPIGLMFDAVVKTKVEPGQVITFADADVPDSLALTAWQEIAQAYEEVPPRQI